MPDQNKRNCVICLGITAVLLIVILVPLTFSYVEYYEYGLDQRKTTGSVDTYRVYNRGRYNLGPDHHFIKYQADAHLEAFDELAVFSAGGTNESIGLEFLIDVDFTFFLIEEDIGILHKELASNYRDFIVSRAKEGIKNEAIYVTFTEYFQERKEVEARFRNAVQARWTSYPPLHCTLDQFHLGRVRIPESVANKQLQSKIQNERNDKERFLQQAQLERELTSVEVNQVNLETQKVLRTAEAEASLIRAKAIALAERTKAEAGINGTTLLLLASDIVTQEHKTAFTYIRTLRNRKSLDIDVSYLSSDNVLRTSPISAP